MHFQAISDPIQQLVSKLGRGILLQNFGTGIGCNEVMHQHIDRTRQNSILIRSSSIMYG